MRRPAILALALLLVAGGVIAHPTPEEQERALAEELRLQPGNPTHLLRRAQVRFDDGELDGARADLAAARASGPLIPAIDFVLARVEMEAGRPRAALVAVDAFLGHEPRHAAALVLRARALDRLRDVIAARAAWRIAADATIASGRSATALYLEAAEHQPRAESLALLELGVARCGPQPLLVKRAGALLLDDGEGARALAHVDAWLATPSGARQPDALGLRARALAVLGRHDEARAAVLAASAALDGSPRRVGSAIRAAAERDLAAASAILATVAP